MNDTTSPIDRETPHPASGTDAGTGQGTISEIPTGEGTLDHSILDGSTESAEAERTTDNPFRGVEDPALGEFAYGDETVLPPRTSNSGETDADPSDDEEA